MDNQEQSQGNIGLGIALGFFLGCFGLIGVHLFKAGAETKKGALYGFGAGIVIGVILNVAAMALQ